MIYVASYWVRECGQYQGSAWFCYICSGNIEFLGAYLAIHICESIHTVTISIAN